jgi:hypothetical protein
MGDLCGFIWRALAGLFRSRTALQAEILILRHQLNVLRRRSPKRVTLSTVDRLVFVGLHRLAPKVLDALAMLQPETVIRWHRVGFRAYWRWKSGPAKDSPGHSQAYSRDERCHPLVGSAADSLRTAQAGDRCRPDHGCKIHGEEKAAPVARMEDVPSQSCRRHRVHRHVRRPNDLVSAAVWTSGPATFADATDWAWFRLLNG